MTTFSPYNLYAMNINSGLVKKTDEVDSYINELKNLSEYDEILNFVKENFGEFESEKLLNFPELDKQIHILVEDNKIEICAAKNAQQYFGRGWMICNSQK